MAAWVSFEHHTAHGPAGGLNKRNSGRMHVIWTMEVGPNSLAEILKSDGEHLKVFNMLIFAKVKGKDAPYWVST